MSNIKWYVGQPIVCIQTHSQGVVKKGEEYTIQGVRQQECCGVIVLNVGMYNTNPDLRCTCKNISIDGIHWLGDKLFAPLDVDISELTEILKKEFQKKY